MGNLTTPNSVQKLQTALHAKAKAEADYRFYALYDKISREDILAHAFAQCRSNQGAPGVDGQDFADIEAYGVERWLGELALALRNETYKPDPIRRVFIPKPNGKLRPLGISTVRDRVCMTAATLVLEPIFEADLPSELYAYRAGRNAQQAVTEVEEQLFRGHPDVVDADLADYFGSIPHADLMKSVARRVVDRRVLYLIKMWLECPVEETDDRGRKTRTTEARDNHRGIPQGSPISPLLANLYMRRFVLGWKKLGLEQSLGARLVTYADDLVILCRRGKAEDALRHLREIMGKLKLTVSEEKTRICKVPEGEFDFLGYTISETRIPIRFGNLPTHIYPDRPGLVLRTQGDGYALDAMRWGFPKVDKDWGTNARNIFEKNGKLSNWWGPWTGLEYRCLVPATSFFEPDGRTVGTGAFREVEFARPDSEPFFLAGMWRPWSGIRGTKKEPVEGDHELYTFLTTSPNALVKPVHYKAMPVILSWDDAEVWLNEPIEDAIALQKPAPEDALVIVGIWSKGEKVA